MMQRTLACAVALTFVTIGVPQAAHAAPADGSWASSESGPPSDNIASQLRSAAKPKNGNYSGEIAKSTTDPIYFSVAKSTVSGLIGSAPTSPNNCPKKIDAFALPSGDIKIKNGHFHESSSSYPYGATVGIKGSFVSTKQAKGKVSVSFKNKNKPCSDTVPFTATWVKPSGGGTTP